MIDAKIKRINELAKKSREVGLTPEEEAERATLRQEYVAAFRESLKSTLDNTYIVDPEGNKTKVTQKYDPSKKDFS